LCSFAAIVAAIVAAAIVAATIPTAATLAAVLRDLLPFPAAIRPAVAVAIANSKPATAIAGVAGSSICVPGISGSGGGISPQGDAVQGHNNQKHKQDPN